MTTRKRPANPKPTTAAHRPLGTTIDRQKFAAFCAESSAVLCHLHDRFVAVLKAVGSTEGWIDRDRLRGVSHRVEEALGLLAVMPFEPEADLPDPVEPIVPRDAKGGRP